MIKQALNAINTFLIEWTEYRHQQLKLGKFQSD